MVWQWVSGWCSAGCRADCCSWARSSQRSGYTWWAGKAQWSICRPCQLNFTVLEHFSMSSCIHIAMRLHMPRVFAAWSMTKFRHLSFAVKCCASDMLCAVVSAEGCSLPSRAFIFLISLSSWVRFNAFADAFEHHCALYTRILDTLDHRYVFRRMRWPTDLDDL